MVRSKLFLLCQKTFSFTKSLSFSSEEVAILLVDLCSALKETSTLTTNPLQQVDAELFEMMPKF